MLIARIDEPVIWQDRVATRVGVNRPIYNCHIAFQELREVGQRGLTPSEALCVKNTTQSEPFIPECPSGDAKT